jgi:hypothetical protein
VTRARLLPTALAVLLAPACDDLVVRGCSVTESSGSNTYGLDYEVLIPSDCPVPLAIPGEETKYASAVVYDDGTSDFRWAVAEVENSAGLLLNRNRIEFGLDEEDRHVAAPRVLYVAATGRRNWSDFDYGYFVATNRQFGDDPGDPYGEIKITYKQSVLAARSIAGPQIPPRNTTGTWSVAPTGGVTPYAYHWYRDSVLVGTGASYSGNVGTRDFWLRVEVTDQTWSVRRTVLAVDVDGVRGTITGPGSVFLSQPQATWTASIQGGFSPYRYEWFADGALVATGPTYSATVGSDFQLMLLVRDSIGQTHTTELRVRAFDDTCTGEWCEPK